MDKTDTAEKKAAAGEKKPGRWAWLPAQMPGVVALIAERRKAHGSAWVNTCWQRGVEQGEAGWFFAGQGALMVGTIWDDPQIVAFAAGRITRTQALLITKPPEGNDGPQ